jgi:5-aminolevulinate synthase
MDYEGFFKERLDALRAEGRYRVFADLERRCGRFPRAFDHRIGAEVTVLVLERLSRHGPTPSRAGGDGRGA